MASGCSAAVKAAFVKTWWNKQLVAPGETTVASSRVSKSRFYLQNSANSDFIDKVHVNSLWGAKDGFNFQVLCHPHRPAPDADLALKKHVAA